MLTHYNQNIKRNWANWLALFLLLAGCNNEQEKLEEEYTKYIDPMIGTGAHGHTFPGVTTPFGMVQLSPDNGISGWDWCSGYHYSSNEIIGFSHTHLSGTGVGDLRDVLVMPTTKPLVQDTSKNGKRFIRNYISTFSHANEIAEAGYYKVLLDSGGIKAELTATPRTGFHKYTFPKEDTAKIIVDLAWNVYWDKPLESGFEILDSQTVVGYRHSKGWANYQKLYFAIRFNQPFSKHQLIKNGEFVGGDTLNGIFTDAAFYFEASSEQEVLMKVGISSADIAGAVKNLETENPSWDFDAVKQSTKSAWQKEIAPIRVKMPEDSLNTVFYTALYHTMMAPSLYSDVDGRHTNINQNRIDQVQGFDHYHIYSLWDTYRAANVWYTLTQPERVNDFVKSMLVLYDQSGLLPVWSLWGNETGTMIGYHAVPVIVDAYLKGLVNDVEAERMYKAIMASAYQEIRQSPLYREYGYIPADSLTNTVSKTLEYAYDDWTIAQMAKALGKTEDYEKMMERSLYYRNHFDPETKLMRAKLANGEWKEPFDPFLSTYKNDYTEGNAWQFTWYVPHNVPDLINLMGGKEPFANLLDTVFVLTPDMGEKAAKDISGMIGQYVHGNEPSHHMVYLYNYVDQPWKTQARVREIMQVMYGAGPEGLSGNEDCGQMSAWYLFSALGFYPVNPVGGVYDIGSPTVESAELDLPNGKVFKVKALNQSLENIYVKKVTWNGAEIKDWKITHDQIMEGGTLLFEMSNTPSTL